MIPLTDEGNLWERHFSSAEMVIEAVPENLDLKHRYRSVCWKFHALL